MFASLFLLGIAVELPDTAKDLEGGVFGWANALAPQRALLDGYHFNFGRWKIFFQNGDI
jgi:hypothetical protein